MTFPKNGPLSGMVIVATTAVLAAVGGLIEPVRDVFAADLSPGVLDAFGFTIALMAAHKVESWLAGEHRRCPVYLTQVHAARGDPGRLLFQGFVPTIVAGLVVAWLLMHGPPWHLLLLSIWCAQGLHEWHHLAKSAVERRYYPGAVTALVFVLTMDAWFFPEWVGLLATDREVLTWAYYGVQPLLIAAFAVEHRQWFARYAAWTTAQA